MSTQDSPAHTTPPHDAVAGPAAAAALAAAAAATEDGAALGAVAESFVRMLRRAALCSKAAEGPTRNQEANSRRQSKAPTVRRQVEEVESGFTRLLEEAGVDSGGRALGHLGDVGGGDSWQIGRQSAGKSLEAIQRARFVP